MHRLHVEVNFRKSPCVQDLVLKNHFKGTSLNLHSWRHSFWHQRLLLGGGNWSRILSTLPYSVLFECISTMIPCDDPDEKLAEHNDF